jgi:hypothetical protein
LHPVLLADFFKCVSAFCDGYQEANEAVGNVEGLLECQPISVGESQLIAERITQIRRASSDESVTTTGTRSKPLLMLLASQWWNGRCQHF